jgi:hypothetical protein
LKILQKLPIPDYSNVQLLEKYPIGKERQLFPALHPSSQSLNLIAVKLQDHFTLDNNQILPRKNKADKTGMIKLSSSPHKSIASASPATSPVKPHSSHNASLLVERVHETLPSRVKLKSKMECFDQ